MYTRRIHSSSVLFLFLFVHVDCFCSVETSPKYSNAHTTVSCSSVSHLSGSSFPYLQAFFYSFTRLLYFYSNRAINDDLPISLHMGAFIPTIEVRLVIAI